MWNLLCYVSNGGKCDFLDNLGSSGFAVQAAFESYAAKHSKLERQYWQRPDAEKLKSHSKGAFREYFAWRIYVNKVQYRPIGYFGPGPQDFTFLVWVTEKGWRYRPKDWVKKADNARKTIDGAAAKGDMTNVTRFPFEEDEG